VETAGPSGARFQALAFCLSRLPGGFSGPELREAAMLILPDPGPRQPDVLAVGSTCRICPRADCVRRPNAVLTGAADHRIVSACRAQQGALGGATAMGKSVLLIEDEENIAEAIRFILSRDGWQVVHLAEGQGAAARAAELLPDLVILDHMLPGATGLEILADLKANPATARLPVLMLTAKGQPRDREAAERAGADGFMSKPFANAEILAEVRALTGTATGTSTGTA